MNLRSQISKPLEAPKSFDTDYTSQLRLQSQDGVNPATPQNKQRGAKSANIRPVDFFLSVPDEVLVQIVTRLDSTSDLCSLAYLNRRWQNLVEGCSNHWRSLFQQAYCIGVPVSPAQHRAAELATSWKKLFRSRFLAEAEVAPWEKPSPFEIQAAIEQMFLRPYHTTITKYAAPTSVDGTDPFLLSPVTQQQQQEEQNQDQDQKEEPCIIIFLVDGSGSVTEDDFNCMTSFMLTAANLIKSTKQSHQHIHLGVIQFSNEVRVELPPTRINGVVVKNENGGEVEGRNNFENEGAEEEESTIFTAVESMFRMNGGTNIAAAIQKAGQLFKNLATSYNSQDAESSTKGTPRSAREVKKVIALLTDGRIDSFQAHEAKEITSRLVDEQGNVALHAFGVGRGVDRVELLRIISGACPAGEDPAHRYLPLMVLEDAPW